MRSHNFIDLTGLRFERLFVLEQGPKIERKARWRCRCDCGKETIVTGTYLRTGKIKSCGCLKRDNIVRRSTKHGCGQRSNSTREYRAWKAAKSRCFNKNTIQYKDYGERGITMCDDWKNDFNAFLEDVGECPPGLTLDRYPDNNGNYEPGNVRWATRREQNNNKRKTPHDALFSQPPM